MCFIDRCNVKSLNCNCFNRQTKKMTPIITISFGLLFIFIIPAEGKYGEYCSHDFDCHNIYEVCRNDRCICSRDAHLRNGKCRSKTFCQIDDDCEDGKYCVGTGVCRAKETEKPANTENGSSLKTFGIVAGSLFGSFILIVVLVIIVNVFGCSCPDCTCESSSAGPRTVTAVPPPITTQVSYCASPPSYENTVSQGVLLSAEPVEHTFSQAIPLSTVGQPIKGTPVY